MDNKQGTLGWEHQANTKIFKNWIKILNIPGA
jgi:hypothetical protein